VNLLSSHTKTLDAGVTNARCSVTRYVDVPGCVRKVYQFSKNLALKKAAEGLPIT
jgi:hypothetical protein